VGLGVLVCIFGVVVLAVLVGVGFGGFVDFDCYIILV